LILLQKKELKYIEKVFYLTQVGKKDGGAALIKHVSILYI